MTRLRAPGARALAWPLLALAGVAALSVWAWHAVAAVEQQRDRQRVAAAADSVRTAIEGFLSTRLGIFVRSVDRIAGMPAETHERLFRTDANLQQRDFSGLVSVYWVDPDGTIRWAAGDSGAAAWEGTWFASNTARRDALADVAGVREARLTPVMMLRTGALGMLFLQPIVSQDRVGPLGYYVAGIETTALFDAVLRTTAEGYGVAVADGDRVLYRRGGESSPPAGDWKETRMARLYGRTWRIETWPDAGVAREFVPILPRLILVSGLLLGLLLALALYLAGMARMRAEAAERAAEALRASQERLATAYRVGRLGAWSLGLEYGEAGWSDELRELLGVGSDVVPTLERTLALVHPHDRAAVRLAVEELRGGRPGLDITVRFVRPDARIVWLHAVAELQRDADGRPAHVIGVAQDVTPLLETVERLRKSETLLARAQRVGRLGGWTRRLDSADPALVSPELYALFGLDPDEFVPTSENMLGLIAPEDRPAIARGLAALFNTGTPLDRTVRAVRTDGSTFWMRMVAELMPDETGAGHVVVGIAHDVSEQHEAFERLRVSEAALARGQRIAGLGSWEVRLDPVACRAETVSWSDETYRIFGYEPREVEVCAEFFFRHVHPDDLGALRRHEAEALARGEYAAVDYRIVARNGRVLVLHQEADVLRDDSGTVVGLLGTVQDITARRAGEAALARTLTDLELRNEELQSFAFAASHDLQEPLRKIQAFGDRLAQRFGATLGPDGRDYLARMESAAGRMRRLIDDLLSYSRVTTRAQPFAPVALGDVLREVLSDLETPIEQSGARVVAHELPTLRADRTQLQQVLQNLVGNAIKFRAAGRAPVVEVAAEPLERDGARWWRIRVADNGIGFEDRFRERIFAPFQRLHGRAEYEGTGIGLAIVRRIVERHGGHVEAHGRPGEGATFVVELPAEPRSAAAN